MLLQLSTFAFVAIVCAVPITATQGAQDRSSTSGILVQQHHAGSNIFDRTWAEYRAGFGNKNDDYWIGNNRLHELTKDNGYKLRIDLLGKNEVWYYAEYETFVVEDESAGYRLHFGRYNGTAGDGLGGFDSCCADDLNNMKFTTWDRDNDLADGFNCARNGVISGGFWYNKCAFVYINGSPNADAGFAWYGLPGQTSTFRNLLISRMTLVAK